jgi:hypothetical protein
VESVVVVFSILLALVVNEWRQEAEREDRRERATEAIRAELLYNYGELREVHPYHDRLADTLMALSRARVDSVDPGVRPQGWVRTSDLVSAAWEAAAATGTTSDFPYDDLLTLSRAYEEQAVFRDRKERLFDAVLRMAQGGDRWSLLRNPGGMGLVLNTLSDWEANLLREYERALGALGVPADSLEGAAEARGKSRGEGSGETPG